MRPIDLARQHGLSAQAVRNYEDDGILPPAGRTESGYRSYDRLHVQALTAFVALRRGHGYQQAAEMMRATNRGDVESVYRMIDTGHVALLAERDSAGESTSILGFLSDTDLTTIDIQVLTVGELARRVGVHPATLRTWEVEGIVHPERNRATGYREYGARCVRDAEIAQQLRRGGYRLAQVAEFVASLRQAGGADPFRQFVESWRRRLTARSRDLLAGAAALDAYLRLLNPSTPEPQAPGSYK